MRKMSILYTYLTLCLFSATNARIINASQTPDLKSTLSEYERNRTNILRQESMYSLGSTLRLNYEEVLVNNILMKLKEDEVSKSFYHKSRFEFSKHYFTYKRYIEQSKVYQIIKRMPKGAALHSHSTFVSDGDHLLNLTYEDHLYACYTGSNVSLQFSDTAPQRPCSVDWTLLSKLRNETDNVTGFDAELKRYFTLSNEDEDNIRADVNAAWSRFDQIQTSIKALISCRPIREKYIYDTLQKIYDDNIMYTEIRCGLHYLHELNGSEHDPTYLAKLYNDVAQRFIKHHPDFIGVKLIITTSRLNGVEILKESLNMTMKMQAEYPQMVAGFDIVGREDRGNPLSHYVPTILETKDKVNFYLHAGETNWFGTLSDENLIDAILLNSKRIGHAYALIKHPVLMSLVKQEDIPIEVNVISNAVLALVTDVRNHPLATFLSLGYSIVLSSDDPGLWGADPLSHDFYIAFVAVASQHADLRLLKQLALNSIKYSDLDNRRRTKLYEVFHRRWNNFIQQVIAEYSSTLV